MTEALQITEIPLFPLRTVLFPGGPLPLRIFEARYIDMVGQCMKSESPFGVCMISHGKEVGEAADTVKTGTLARIIDWHTRHDGLLGITVIGEQRFRVEATRVEANQLVIASIEVLPDEPGIELPGEYLALSDLLHKLLDQAGHHYNDIPTRHNDASWVSYRLAEILPIKPKLKIQFLELTDPLIRLHQISELLEGMKIV